MRYVVLSAIDRRVTLAAYVRAVKLANARPDAEFKHGLECWWPCKGREIVEQFRQGMHERISSGIPAIKRGRDD